MKRYYPEMKKASKQIDRETNRDPHSQTDRDKYSHIFICDKWRKKDIDKNKMNRDPDTHTHTHTNTHAFEHNYTAYTLYKPHKFTYINTHKLHKHLLKKIRKKNNNK